MELFPHQASALDETSGFNRVAYYHDMGLGKTFTGAEKLNRLDGRINLVICQKSKLTDWTKHFKYYYDMVIYDLTQKKEFCNYITDVNDYMDKPLIGVVNYDLIFRRPEILKIKYDTVMLDESSVIQTRTTKRSKAILNLKTDNTILLSGTPTGGRYEKIWSQIRLLGWDISEELFYKQYVKYHYEDNEGFPRRVIDGYKNIDRLKDKLKDYGAHFLKTEEVFDLPEQVFNEIIVPKSIEYKKFEKSRMITINDIEFIGDTTLTFDLYKRMLCGAYSKNKIDTIEDILNSTDDRVIIFYNFNSELFAIEDVCIKLNKPMSIINGQTKDLSMYDDYDNSVTVVQYQAGAMGLNLQKSNKIIYITPPTKSELFEQSKKRTHRIGQARTCFYYILKCEKSVEEKIYMRLKERKDYDDYLFE